MNKNSKILWILVICFGLTIGSIVFAAGDFFIHDGDRVVFLGDSITEQRLYTTFIEAYALTRYPQWKLTFRNTGWSGDTAFFRSRCHTDGGKLMAADESTQQPMIDETIRRGLGRDVLPLKPTVVTIDFGMNDIFVKPTNNVYSTYLSCMTKMVTVLQENGARTALLTPQPTEPKRSDPDQDENNKALRKFSDGLKEVAAKTGMAYVDQFDPYMKMLLRERAGNPDVFIGGGRDTVHPGAAGHTVMAWAILKGLGATPLVSRAQIDCKAQRVIAVEACKIENLKMSNGVIGFDRLDAALPMPIHPQAGSALKLAPVLEDLNRYELQITGLAPGDYQLSIDGEPVTEITADELGQGLNLATNAGSITQQGQELLKEVGKKNDLFFKRWRNVQLRSAPGQAPSLETDPQRVAELVELDQQIAESESKIDKLRQPKIHRFELRSMQAPVTLTLWPTGNMPGLGTKEGVAEKEVPSRGDGVVRIADVSEPAIAVFKAPGATNVTPAVIICPGGAYNILAYNKEGTEIAAWLNSIGITGVVLKYRVPGNMDGAFQDIQRAIRLVRDNAAKWNIDSDRVGVMGFSAGGHLCARLSTNWDQATYPELDAVDKKNIRPDFAILVYPAYLSQVPGQLSGSLPVNAKMPPTFMVHTEDDKSFVPGSKLYHAALDEAKVQNEFFLCAEGGHGYGLISKKEVGVWPEKCKEWLFKSGIL